MIKKPTTTATFFPSDELFRNPHKGFTTFQRFRGDELYEETLGETWSKEIGWKMESLPENDGMFREFGIKGYPDTSIAYFRIPWRKLEPQKDSYDFSVIDKFLERASERGQKVMFRFTPHAARPQEDLELPQWIIEKLNLPLREIRDKRSPICDYFFDNYAKLIEKIGEHIDGNERVSSIDISVVSAWGEGDQMSELPFKYKKQMADTYAKAFKNTVLSVQFNDNEFIEYMRSLKPVGLRLDCLGAICWPHMSLWYPKVFADFPDLWKTGPINFEAGWVVRHWQEMGWDIDYIIEESLHWHISTFNAKSVAIPEALTEKMENWIKRMGYRFCLRIIEYPEKANAGDILAFDILMQNRGVAPIYHKYPFVIRLKSEGGTVYDFDTKEDITTWLPGDILLKPQITLPCDLPRGRYTLSVGITDDDTVVRMANPTPHQNGFDSVGEITIE